MKNFIKFILSLLIIVVIAVTLFLGYLGFVPGLSALFGTDKPIDLGVRYTEADRAAIRAQTKVDYTTLPDNTSAAASLQRIGSHPAKIEYSSTEATALMNDRPWKYWPYKSVQLRFNNDGSAEISGVLIKDRLGAYGEYIGAPKQAIDFALKFLPTDPVFYLKGRGELVDNKVSVFDPQVFQIGRMPMPIGVFLSYRDPRFERQVYAQSSDMISELSKVQNKRALIIDFINQRLAQMTGFYAKSARVENGKLLFDGTLPDKEATLR